MDSKMYDRNGFLKPQYAALTDSQIREMTYNNDINEIDSRTNFGKITTWIFIWISGFKQKTAISLTILPKLNISIDFLILTVIIIVKFICIRHDVIGFFA